MKTTHHRFGALLLAAALCLPAPSFAQAAPAVPSASVPPASAIQQAPRAEIPFSPQTSYADRVLSEDTVWRGQVLVEGAVTVLPQATLTVEAGTVVRFRQKGALVVQGRIVAAGSAEAPILFASIFAAPMAGDWQGVMLLGSEKNNTLENCRIDGAKAGLEALFSNVTLKNVRASRCATGMRFQDALVNMESGGASDCDTGMYLGDAEAVMRSPNLVGNRIGISASRSSVYVEEGSFAMNRSAFAGDICRVKIQGGAVLDNGRGITLNECQGSVAGVKVARNSDYGMSLSASRMRVTGNVITGNGGHGLLVFDGGSVAWGNAIHDNTGYDLYNAGVQEFRAPGNWWGAAPKMYEGIGKMIVEPKLNATPIDN